MSDEMRAKKEHKEEINHATSYTSTGMRGRGWELLHQATGHGFVVRLDDGRIVRECPCCGAAIGTVRQGSMIGQRMAG